MIRIRDLNLTFAGGRKIFDGLNWQIDAGSRTGLVGPNGVGKTTLLRAIVGQVSADSGEINVSLFPRRSVICPRIWRSCPTSR